MPRATRRRIVRRAAGVSFYMRAVAAARSAVLAPLLAPLLAVSGSVLLGGCVDVNGGAVEVSWVVRTPDGRAISDCGCTDPHIASVRINLGGPGGVEDGGADPCHDNDACRFSCQRQTGATTFTIPPGSYSVSVSALGDDGAELGAPVQTPAPILRDVAKGQVTELEAFLIVTGCAGNCSGTNGTGVCTRQ